MAHLMVFTPAPQLTVTIERHHDQSELHVHPGGQGIWQTRMITSLGAEVTLVAAVGGEVGEQPEAPLARHELDELCSYALAEGLRAGIAVLSGPAHPSVIDPDVYRRLAADLGANGCRVIADLSAATLARGGSLHDAVRTGAAAGALNVTRHGLGTGHLDAVRVRTDLVELTLLKADS